MVTRSGRCARGGSHGAAVAALSKLERTLGVDGSKASAAAADAGSQNAGGKLEGWGWLTQRLARLSSTVDGRTRLGRTYTPRKDEPELAAAALRRELQEETTELSGARGEKRTEKHYVHLRTKCEATVTVKEASCTAEGWSRSAGRPWWRGCRRSRRSRQGMRK